MNAEKKPDKNTENKLKMDVVENPIEPKHTSALDKPELLTCQLRTKREETDESGTTIAFKSSETGIGMGTLKYKQFED